MLRINSILRRASKPAAALPVLKLGQWVYNASRDELKSAKETIRLTDMEAGSMRILASEPGVVISREVLGDRSKGVINDRTIDVQLHA